MKTHLFNSIIVVALLSLLTACSSQEQGSPDDGFPALKAEFNASVGESAYPHRVYLVKDQVIDKVAKAPTASQLSPFRVKTGNYRLFAVAASSESNLTFSSEEGSGLSLYNIKIADISKPVPDILIGGTTDVVINDKNVSAPLVLTRAVSLVTVTVTGLKALSDNTLTMTIPNMYDQIDSEGKPRKSGEHFTAKTITLTKNKEGLYIGQEVVLPTDIALQTIELIYTIHGKEYRTTQNTKIEPNKKYNISVIAQFSDDNTIKLVPSISYAPWNDKIDIIDDNLPVIDDRPANKNFTVEVFRNNRWEKSFVHNAKVSEYTSYAQYNMGFAMFTDNFEQPLKVRVTHHTKSFSTVQIRPLSYGITPSQQTSKSVEFELTDPSQKVSVEFDGDRMENLFILPDLPDKNIPTGANVTYFGPGIHNVGKMEILYKSNQTLYIDEGAIVYGSIIAKGCPNLSIRGRGILCSSKENHADGRQPQIELFNCDNFKIEGIMLRDTPNWTIKIVGSTGVNINNIKQIGWMKNSDGIDFICCRNVVVENTFQRNYDDNVTIKAFNAKQEYLDTHTNSDGSFTDASIWTVYYLPSNKFDVYDYEIRNCVFWADKAHNMLVGPESRGISFKNIRFKNNIVLENRQNDAVYPGVMAVMVADNGTFEDILFEDIEVEDINGGKVLSVQFTNTFSDRNLYGQWAKNITFKNITYTGTRASQSWIKGRNDSQCIDGVKICNFKVNGSAVTSGSGSYLQIGAYVKNVNFE